MVQITGKEVGTIGYGLMGMTQQNPFTIHVPNKKDRPYLASKLR